MIALLGSTAAQIVGVIGMLGAAVGALMWLGRRGGADHAQVRTDAQTAATQADVIARERAMAKAQADAPRDATGVISRLDDGSF